MLLRDFYKTFLNKKLRLERAYFMKQQRDSKERFLPKPKNLLPTRVGTKVITLPEDTTPIYMYEQRMYTEQDILNAYIAGISDSGKGFLLPSKKAELYLRNLK